LKIGREERQNLERFKFCFFIEKVEMKRVDNAILRRLLGATSFEKEAYGAETLGEVRALFIKRVARR